MKMRHEVTYQGYPAKAVQFRRGPGLSPEGGWVDLEMKDVKALKVIPRDIPWRAVNGFEMNGQVDIKTWFNLQKDQTVTGLAPLPTPEGGGMNPFGDLVLATYDDASGVLVDKITYSDVYIGAGMEEVTADLANIESHNVGTVRVQLTDIRRWWRLGALVCKINRRLKSGNWDDSSLNDGQPWPLRTVLQFLCSQLPGSPAVAAFSEAFAGGASYDPPTDVTGDGEPAVEHLQRVLDHYGLVANLLPTNNLAISKKYSPKLGYKKVAGANGAEISVPQGGAGLHYERKSSAPTDRPPAVVVIGKRRVKRGTFSYIPVLQYVDGRYYPLQTALDFMGYPKSSLDAAIFNNTHRRFRDVPPQPGEGNDGRLHEKHRQILSMAYRVYAPAFLFPESGGTGAAMPDQAARLSPYLPIVDCPWYIRELGSRQIPEDTRGKGDQDDYVLLPPIARGVRRGTQFFRDLGAIDAYFAGKIRNQDALVDDLRALAKKQRERLAKIGDELTSADDFAEQTFKSSEIGAKWKAQNAAKFFRLNQDAVNAAAAVGFGKVFDKDFVNDQMSGFGIVASIEIDRLAKEIKTLEDLIEKNGELVSDWSAKFEAYKRVYQARGGIPVVFNAPYDALEEGTFKVDPETGILTSSQPLCQVDKPFFFDGDSVRVVADGAVTVTYGYELKDNNIGAMTAFLFTTSGGENGPADAVFAGVCRSSPLKALSVPMNARMYLLDEGTPVNFNACYSEAYGKAAALLAQPSTMEGYVYEMDGFRNCWVDAGVSSVQHAWDAETRPAYTFVAINSPGAKLPGGPPMVPSIDRRAVRAERAEAIERERTE